MGIFLFELCHAPLKAELSPVSLLAPSACAVLRGYSLGICFVRAVARATRLGRTEGTEVVKLTGICTRNESERQRLDTEGRRGRAVRCSIDNFFVLLFVLFGCLSLPLSPFVSLSVRYQFSYGTKVANGLLSF